MSTSYLGVSNKVLRIAAPDNGYYRFLLSLLSAGTRFPLVVNSDNSISTYTTSIVVPKGFRYSDGIEDLSVFDLHEINFVNYNSYAEKPLRAEKAGNTVGYNVDAVDLVGGKKLLIYLTNVRTYIRKSGANSNPMVLYQIIYR